MLTGWNPQQLPEKELILISSDSADGTFLLPHFLTLFLKAESNVILLTAAQTPDHYKVICSKFGVNLGRCQQEKKFKILNLLEASLRCYVEETNASSESDSDLLAAFRNNSMKLIYKEIKSNLNLESKNFVVLDDISILLSIGFSEKDLINFIHYMKVLCGTSICAFLTHYQREVTSGQSAPKLYEHCRFYSTSELQIQGLKSGYSKDVSGNLNFVTKTKDFEKRITITEMQYKLTDRTLKLFAPGTSSAVL